MLQARAPFIWTPRQPIRPDGFLHVLGGAPPRSDGQNRWFLFRRTMDLTGTPSAAELSITVDGRYQLFLNGERVGRGPVRCSPLFQRYDTYDIGPRLRAGRNVVAVLVHTYGVDTAFYEGVRGMWRPTFGEGGLWVQGWAETDDRRKPLTSDTDWRCTQSDAWLQDAPRVNSGLGFIEALDAAKLPDDWTSLDFDDSAWDAARVLRAGGGGPESDFGGITTEPFPTLVPRGIPHLDERPAAAERIVWIKGQYSVPDLPLGKRLYKEPLGPAPEGAISDPEHLLRFEGGSAIIRTLPGVDTAVLLDFGRIVTGHPRIEIEARGGETIEIACSEHLPGEWEGAAADARITPVPLLGLDAHLCRYTARPGRQVFERFEWTAIRWMQLVVRDAPEGVVVRGLGATLVNYPVEERGSFSSSDPLLDRLWSTGAYTLRQCMHDAWEDCPSREQRQWLGDATVENLAGWAAFGPCVAPLNAKFLLQAAESQRPDGLTQMFAPGDHAHDGLLIPDWTLQWVLNAGDHYRLTADLDTIETIFPAIQKALAWFERLIGPSGLLADLPYWHFMDWAGLGRHGEAATLNAQLAGAFGVAAELAQALGSVRISDRYLARAQSIGAALNARHWDERRGAYVDSVDPVTSEQAPRTSQHGNAAMALWGAAPDDRAARALSRISDSARLTFTAAPPIVPKGPRLDSEDGVVLANTFYSHFVYEALASRGRLPAALRLMRERFGPMLDRGATTLWESFEPTASLCHGFSASPTYQLSRRVLGVFPAEPGFAGIGVAPDLAGLDHAEGVVPTPHGDVHVRLQRDGDGFTADVRGPAGVPLELQPAPGLVRAGDNRFAPEPRP
jgi:hypothetical protein